MMERKILWSDDATNDLIGIIQFIKDQSGIKIAESIYAKIREKIEKIKEFPNSGSQVPELAMLGIQSHRELIEGPWRIIYVTSEQQIRVVTVVDSRRNVGDILYRKMIFA